MVSPSYFKILRAVAVYRGLLGRQNQAIIFSNTQNTGLRS